ncbi:hypothetical protein BC940DRAFT_62319 [Gongronella butleri]|nr:hypothetical protein BC940DRAFT_62319 [Gongronella butleri]
MTTLSSCCCSATKPYFFCQWRVLAILRPPSTLILSKITRLSTPAARTGTVASRSAGFAASFKVTNSLHWMRSRPSTTHAHFWFKTTAGPWWTILTWTCRQSRLTSHTATSSRHMCLSNSRAIKRSMPC